MNKEQVIDYLNEKGACNSALACFITYTGTLKEAYNECFVDWRIWLHYQLGLDGKPYEKYNVVVKAAYGRYANDEITHAEWTKIESDAGQKSQDETMKVWAVVEKALQEAIDNS